MMKNLLKIILVLLIFGGCEDWLSTTPKSTLTTETFYKNESHANAAVNAAYAFISAEYGGYLNYGETPYFIHDYMTGQFYTKVGQALYGMEGSNLNVSAQNAYVGWYWDNAYQGIEAANLAIANIPAIEMDETEKGNLMAQARFIRAYFYFDLIRIYGDVPMKTEPTDGAEDGNLPKTSIKDIYEQIIVPDLQAAKQSALPYNSTDGRVTIGAVQTLLAKVYLTMAGYPLNQKDKYAMARDEAKEVIDSGAYSLFQTDQGGQSWIDKFRSVDNDNQGEHIFMAQYNGTDSYNNVPIFTMPSDPGAQGINTSLVQFGSFYPTQDFLDSYPSGDIRRQNQGFFYNSYSHNGQNWNFPWAVYKHFDNNLVNTHQSSKNFSIYRYAEVLLIYAEAQNEADSGPNQDAYNAVNQIRSRAGLSDVSGLSQAEFREEVWKQRNWELSGEGKTWFTMLRTQQAFNLQSGNFTEFLGYNLNWSDVTVQEEDLYFPVPLSEQQINPDLAN